MKGSIDKIMSGVGTVLHSVIIPLFALLFTVYYRPYGTFVFLDMENVSFTFNVLMIFCIILVSVLITRVWLYLLGRHRSVSRPVYLIWCFGEMLMSSLFVALYVALISPSPVSYFEAAGLSFVKLLATCIYPYGFLWLGFELYSHNQEEVLPAEDTSLIRFYDEYKKLRFVIAPEAVMFIKSEDNYVQIHYLDQGKTKKFILRSSMRALEDVLARHGLVRCHRSYFINPSYIRIVHRDTSGLIVAEMKQEGCETIPISRKYHSDITRLL